MSRFEVIEINLNTVQTAGELHDTLSCALDFPPGYGMDWNAFWNTINGQVALPLKLHLFGWKEINERLPADAEKLKQCLEDLSRLSPELAAQVQYL